MSAPCTSIRPHAQYGWAHFCAYNVKVTRKRGHHETTMTAKSTMPAHHHINITIVQLPLRYATLHSLCVWHVEHKSWFLGVPEQRQIESNCYMNKWQSANDTRLMKRADERGSLRLVSRNVMKTNCDKHRQWHKQSCHCCCVCIVIATGLLGQDTLLTQYMLAH